MKENTKQKLFATAVLVALLGGSWLIVKYGKDTKDCGQDIIIKKPIFKLICKLQNTK